MDQLLEIQRASIGDLGEIILLAEDKSAPRQRIYGKWIQGWKKALEDRAIRERGYICLLHHDTVIEDRDRFLDLVNAIARMGFAAAGPSDGADGTMRKNLNGRFYLNTCFAICDPREIGEWWQQPDLDGIAMTYEDYWNIVKPVLGKIYYLKTRWREPKIGRATQILFRGDPVACHLWLSSVELRTNDAQPTLEIATRDEIKEWRSRFISAYTKKVVGLENGT